MAILKIGLSGEPVRHLQQRLGVEADGIFGTGADGIFDGGTKSTLKEYQKQNGLQVDGIAGPETLAKIDLFEEITEETVRMSKLPPDVGYESKTASASGGKSIWDTIKGLFD